MTQIETSRGDAVLSEPGRAVRRQTSSAWWNDANVRSILYQIAALVGVVAVFAWFTLNAVGNLQKANIASGFDFLRREAGFGISEGLISYSPADTYGRALYVGFLNTIKIAVIGCVLTTILGTFLGILRLTSNPLLAKLMSVYIEAIRNVPLLLQLFFWYAVVTQLPGPRQALNPIEGVFLSNRGILVPSLVYEPKHDFVIAAVALGVAALFLIWRRLKRRQDATGETSAVWPYAIGLVIGFPIVVGFVVGASLQVEVPELRGFNFQGGMLMSPEFSALLIGLTVYTAAFVAEIVRSGIQAVNRGQWEASQALGIKRGRILRLVVLPQALRIIVPPMTSTYLNYTKNSSLGIAVGYPDLVSVSNTTMNQTGQAVEAIAIFMSVYLTLSLLISAFMNWYNKQVALKEC
jgi:general L-amino acid transport system permease protein